MRGLNCSQIEVDELWGFIGKKQARTSQTDRRCGLGDVWTFLSIDPITKLMPSFLVGKRDHYHATAFMEDLAGRLKNRIQLSSDALNAYADAVERAFGAEIDYAQIVKEYASPSREDQRKYSPASLVAVYKSAITGTTLTSFHSTAVSSNFLRAFSLEGLFTTWNTVGLNSFSRGSYLSRLPTC
jgi:hypothetical protein